MVNYNTPHENLADDYLFGASGFLFAAEIICRQVDTESTEWIFKLDNPVNFLLGHAAELILKAGIAKTGQLENRIKYTHDLLELVNKSREIQVALNEDFCKAAEEINYNFMNHDHRYARTFAGFPDSEYERISKMIENKTADEKELRNYGLVVKRMIDVKKFIAACHSQLNHVSEEPKAPE